MLKLTFLFSLLLLLESCLIQKIKVWPQGPHSDSPRPNSNNPVDDHPDVKPGDLAGFTASVHFKHRNTDIKHTALYELYEQSDSSFSYNTAKSERVSFSDPIFISEEGPFKPNMHLQKCDQYLYRDQPASFKDILAESLEVKKCGPSSLVFCLKVIDANSQLERFVLSPMLGLDIPCPDTLNQDFSFALSSGNAETIRLEEKIYIDAPIAVHEIYLSNEGSCQSGGKWFPYHGLALNWKIAPLGETGIAQVHGKGRDIFGQETECVSDLIKHIDTQNIEESDDFNLKIAEREYTPTRSVTLHLEALRGKEMYITNNPGCQGGGSWETFSQQKPSWLLAETNGLAKVFAKFIDIDGSESPCVQDSIVYDSKPPQNPRIELASGRYTRMNTVDLVFAASGAQEMYITNSTSCDSSGTWEPYEQSKKLWKIDSLNSESTISVKYRDRAGNETACVSTNIFHDNKPPSGIHKLILGDEAPSSDKTPGLTWDAATDGESGIETYELSVGSSAGLSDVRAWMSDQKRQGTMVTGMNLAWGRPYFVNVRAVDKAGNFSERVVSAKFEHGFAFSHFVKASNSMVNGRFGTTMVVDGDTLVVGSPYESSDSRGINSASSSQGGTVENSGAVYIFRRIKNAWKQEAYIKSNNPVKKDHLGLALAIEGDTLVVGAPGDDSGENTIYHGAESSQDKGSENSGAVYVFHRNQANVWQQMAYLKAANVSAGDEFGTAVAIQGETIAVGAHFEDSRKNTVQNKIVPVSDDNEKDSGAVYTFKKSGNKWTRQSFIKANNNAELANFGLRVALSGKFLAVSAANESGSERGVFYDDKTISHQGKNKSGAVYLYESIGSEWRQRAYIKAPNADAGDRFGISMDFVENTLVVGASNEGSIQRFVAQGAGASADNSNTRSGAAYIYAVDPSSGILQQEAYLKASNAGKSAYFGISAATDGKSVVIGALLENSSVQHVINSINVPLNRNKTKSGAAYAFQKIGGKWAQQSYLKAANSDSSDWYGISIAVAGGEIFVGAHDEDSQASGVLKAEAASTDNSKENSGAVYIYHRQ